MDFLLFPPKQHEFFLVDFREAVNGFAANRSSLRSRRAGGDGVAERTVHLPVTRAQLLDRPHRWTERGGGRLHDSGLLAQLSLCDALALPKNAQEGPVAKRHLVIGKPC